ncbi:hypothetical protein [Lacinutrix jangbogonensis]|uniref:hypothetical protein n=1 Tax=Lacinutrix jangbogonensis TaxID=1469557 RepID=UPI00053DF0E4|nr:hypothetical protein [Lacinutrix jangbogonensis]
MKNHLVIFVLALLISSCIPVKIAPDIENYKIVVAKKFKRKLPKTTSFVFNDPKDDGAFYDYLNAKFDLKHIDVGANIPFKLHNKTYYLSYSETERETKTVNLPFVIIDAKRESSGNSKLFEDNYTARKGKWYILLTVYDDNLKNCLKPEYSNSNKVITHLEALRKEYLRTQNYLELQFKKKS